MSAGPIVLHASRLRLVASVVGPAAVLGIGVLSALDGGWTTGPVVLAVVSTGLLAIVLLDLPMQVEFSQDGITRVCPLRREHLPWSVLTAVGRSNDRPGVADLGRRATRSSPRTTGLVARRGAKRTIVLVDRAESHAEWAAVRDLVAPRATSFTAPPPPLQQAPAGRGPRALHRSPG